MKKSIFITGASGFLGSHILFQCDPNKAIGTYQQTKPDDGQYDYLFLDLKKINPFKRTIRAIRPEILIHVAARSHLDWCEENPVAAWKINANGPIEIAKICRKMDCRFVFISSDMVFDGAKGNYSEEEETHPISLYGKAKVAAEQGILREYPDAMVARVALIYGLPVARGRGASFLSWVIDRLEKGENVPLFYDQFRTPVEVQELAQTLLELAKTDYAGIVHVAGSEKIDRFTFGQYVAQIFGYNPELLMKTSWRTASSKAPRPKDLSLATTLLQKLIGHSLSDCQTGLRKTFRHNFGPSQDSLEKISAKYPRA